MDIQRKSFESSNNVNPDWSFKFDEGLQQYVATDFEMTNQVEEFNEHWDTFRAGWQRQPKPRRCRNVLSFIQVMGCLLYVTGVILIQSKVSSGIQQALIVVSNGLGRMMLKMAGKKEKRSLCIT